MGSTSLTTSPGSSRPCEPARPAPSPPSVGPSSLSRASPTPPAGGRSSEPRERVRRARWLRRPAASLPRDQSRSGFGSDPRHPGELPRDAGRRGRRALRSWSPSSRVCALPARGQAESVTRRARLRPGARDIGRSARLPMSRRDPARLPHRYVQAVLGLAHRQRLERHRHEVVGPGGPHVMGATPGSCPGSRPSLPPRCSSSRGTPPRWGRRRPWARSRSLRRRSRRCSRRRL